MSKSLNKLLLLITFSYTRLQIALYVPLFYLVHLPWVPHNSDLCKYQHKFRRLGLTKT